MTFLPRVTTSSKSHSFGYSEDSQSKYKILFFDLLSQYSFYSENALSLVQEPVIAPAEVQIDPLLVKQMEEDIRQAEEIDLPDDDEFWEK